jgi:hypothetical protein
MNLRTISFPVYQVTKKISREGTKLLHYNNEGTPVYLDDKSINLPTLGLRRLKLKETKELYKLTQALFFIKDIVKIKGTTVQFIDSNGTLFNYSKSKYVPLEFKDITKIIPINTGGSLIEIDNENPRYKIMYAPKQDERYVGILRVSPKVYLIYGLFTEKYKDTRRKV